MTVAEWWWLADVKRVQHSGGLTEDGWAELYDFMGYGDS